MTPRMLTGTYNGSTITFEEPAVIREGRLWSLEYLSGRELDSFFRAVTMEKDEIAAVAKNENVSFPFVEKLISSFANLNYENIEWSPSELYITNMNDVTAYDFLGELASNHERLSLDLPTIYARARKLYDLDESIPDVWVEHFLEKLS